MVEQDINTIYDRLYNIAPKLEIRSIPNPRYISEKLGECHICMDEVGKFHNRVNKELSVLKRAFNNAEVAFSIAKDDLLTHDDDIINLPSSKDREARANNKLKDKINELKTYKNEIDCLENLRDTITVKLKDLNRLNADIKIQLRVMEAQIKLGTGGVETEKGLMDELKKTALGQDVWEGVESTVTEEKIVDPSAPIDPNKLMGQNNSSGPLVEGDPFTQLEKIVENEVNNHPIPEDPSTPNKAFNPEGINTELSLNTVNNPSIPEEIVSNPITEQDLTNLLSDTIIAEASTPALQELEAITAPNTSKIEPVIDETVLDNEASDVESDEENERDAFIKIIPDDDVFGSDVITSSDDDIKTEPELDLDKILDPTPEPSSNPDPGGEPEGIINEVPIIKIESEPEKTQEPVKQNTNEISFFDDLLAQFK